MPESIIKIIVGILVIVGLIVYIRSRKNQRKDDSADTSGGLTYHQSEEFKERQDNSGLTQLYAGLRMQLETEFPDEVIEQIHPMNPVYNSSAATMRLKVITNKRQFSYFVNDTDHAKKLYYLKQVNGTIAKIYDTLLTEASVLEELEKMWFEPYPNDAVERIARYFEKKGYQCNRMQNKIEVNRNNE